MKIERKNLLDAAVEMLRTQIVHGRFRPGARLTEMNLASEMGIGRSTVRSALLELEKEELVQRARYSAWAVAEITPRVIWEIYTFRGALEELAARVAATTLDDDKRSTLLSAYKQLERAESGEPSVDRVEADLNFHKIIVRLSGHERLTRQYEVLAHKIEWIYRWSEERAPARIELPDWHKEILDAILDMDPDQAEKAIRANTEANVAADLVELDGQQKLRACVGHST